MDKNLEEAIRLLLDKQAIYEQLMRYCRGCDRNDPDLIAQVYHPDATVDHGIWKVRGSEAPEWAPARKYDYNELDCQSGLKLVGNVLIEVDGDEAFSETYNLIFGGRKEGDRDFTYLRGSRYHDYWQRREDGAWRIAFRISTTDLMRYDEVVKRGPDWWPEVNEPRKSAVHTTFSANFPDDVVYKIKDPEWRRTEIERHPLHHPDRMPSSH